MPECTREDCHDGAVCAVATNMDKATVTYYAYLDTAPKKAPRYCREHGREAASDLADFFEA